MTRVPGVLVALVCISLSLPASAGEKIKLAVMEIKAQRGVDKELTEVTEEFIAAKIAELGGYDVIGRNDIKRLLDHEAQKQLIGCDEDSCLAEIGGAMGVDQMLAGAMAKVGKSLIVTLKLIDVNQAKVLKRELERLRGATEESALDAVTMLYRRMFVDQPKAVAETKTESAPPKAEVTAETVEPVPQPEPEPAGRAEHEEKPSGRLWTWVAAGAAVAFAGTGAALMAVGNKDLDEAQDMADKSAGQQVRYDEAKDLEDKGNTKWTAGGVLLGVGGAAIAAAVVLFFVEGSKDKGAAVAPSVGPDGAGLVVVGRF